MTLDRYMDDFGRDLARAARTRRRRRRVARGVERHEHLPCLAALHELDAPEAAGGEGGLLGHASSFGVSVRQTELMQ